MRIGGIIPFSQEEENKIRKEYLKTPIKRLAKEMGVSPGRINRYLKRNDLKIPREVIEERRRMGQFQKGQTPFTKGLKQTDFMSAETIERLKANWFKKGDTPHNLKEDGSVVSRADNISGKTYKYIKTKDNVWELYHRVIWERSNGKIPERHVITFKDGNTENVSIDNLELMSMTENMYRNSVHDYPEEIIPSLVLIKQLDNKLKDLQDE